jgi:type I restriction enzyme S subunit
MRKTKLSALVTHVRSSVAADALDPTWRFILLEHMAQRTGEITEARAGDFEVKSAKIQFQQGDVLYGKLRPQLRKCCVAPEDGACSGDVAPLRPHFEGSAHYLAAVLRSADFTQRVQRLVAGASLPRVNVKELLELDVLWPEDPRELARRDRIAREAVELRGELTLLSDDIGLLEESTLHW